MCEIMEQLQDAGRAEGRAEGRILTLTNQVLKNLRKNKPLDDIADTLDITVDEVIRIGNENGMNITPQ